MTSPRSFSPRTLILAAVLAVTAYVVPATAATASTAAPTTTTATSATTRPSVAGMHSVGVYGAVQDRGRVSAADLAALPQQSVTTTYTASGVPTTTTFTGPLLLDVENQAGPKFDPAVKNDSLAFAVVARATDGYRAVVSWGEIDPGFENKQVLVALTQDGVALNRPRLVVPGDAKGGRYVSDLLNLRLIDLGGNGPRP